MQITLRIAALKADPEQIVGGCNDYMQGAIFSFPELRDNLTAKLEDARFVATSTRS